MLTAWKFLRRMYSYQLLDYVYCVHAITQIHLGWNVNASKMKQKKFREITSPSQIYPNLFAANFNDSTTSIWRLTKRHAAKSFRAQI